MSAVTVDETPPVATAGFPSWVPATALLAPWLAGGAGLLLSSLPVAVVVMLSVSAVPIGWADVAMRRIPNMSCASLAAFSVAAALAVGEGATGAVVIGALGTSVPFLVMHVMNPAWVGFGDVKLLAALGSTLGLLSPFAGLAALWLAGVGVLVSRPFVPEVWRRSVPFGFWLAVMSVPVALVVGVA